MLLPLPFLHAAPTPAVVEAAASPTIRPSPPAYEHLLLKLDVPGAALLHRYGVEVEVLASPRDSFAFYPFLIAGDVSGTKDFIEGDPDYTYDTRMLAPGLDVQYRRYFGHWSGGRGMYIAPGLELQHYDIDTTQQCVSPSYQYNNPGAPCPTFAPVHQSFTYYGPSFDFGGQAVLRGGFVISGSIGLHYRMVAGSLDTSHLSWAWEASEGPGFRPRLRLEIGWAFL